MSKKTDLLSKAKANTRQPNPSRLQEERPNRGSRIVSFSFLPQIATWIEETTKEIQKVNAGRWNRSDLLSEAILRLQEDFKGMSPDQILKDIKERQIKRV